MRHIESVAKGKYGPPLKIETLEQIAPKICHCLIISVSLWGYPHQIWCEATHTEFGEDLFVGVFWTSRCKVKTIGASPFCYNLNLNQPRSIKYQLCHKSPPGSHFETW